MINFTALLFFTPCLISVVFLFVSLLSFYLAPCTRACHSFMILFLFLSCLPVFYFCLLPCTKLLVTFLSFQLL
ncbi:MAG: hypothetical protein J3R72DRAFT_446805 [Linnemannia gamsii]|nr:MAG: hypothetical protein J3R72DRAFT_446805 [Linnemannia gamsii]